MGEQITSCPIHHHESRGHKKPLPFRRGHIKTMLQKMASGEFLLDSNTSDEEYADMVHAAQILATQYTQPYVLKHFKRPSLDKKEEFYVTFGATYLTRSVKIDKRAWQHIKKEVKRERRSAPQSPYTEKQVMYLTLDSTSVRRMGTPFLSAELYGSLSIFARAYEQQLRNKYKEKFSYELLYQKAKSNLSDFLVRLIAMDGILSGMLHSIAKGGRQVYELPVGLDMVIDPTFLSLGDNDELLVTDTFIRLAHDRIRAEGIDKDNLGRTVDRGCPFLFSKNRKNLIDFAVNELIEQHKLFFKKKKNIFSL